MIRTDLPMGKPVKPFRKKRKNLSEIIKELIKDSPGSGRGDLSLRGEEIPRERLRRKNVGKDFKVYRTKDKRHFKLLPREF